MAKKGKGGGKAAEGNKKAPTQLREGALVFSLRMAG
jgi:hypothetical protein